MHCFQISSNAVLKNAQDQALQLEINMEKTIATRNRPRLLTRQTKASVNTLLVEARHRQSSQVS